MARFLPNEFSTEFGHRKPIAVEGPIPGQPSNVNEIIDLRECGMAKPDPIA